MNRILQGLLILTLMVASLQTGWSQGGAIAEPSGFQGKYQKPSINQRLFGEELAMVGTERDEYAANLAAYAVKVVQEHKADQNSLDLARQVLGLGLHLSPRNKKCIVANAQLARGVMPDRVAADYEPEVFARLLLARGQLLEKHESEINRLLARYFIELAATIDPRNEDAIYESELRRLDLGDLSWKMLTDAKK
ncbi:hypothetical protein JO972_06070 [Verrucomicrobiaceae bacterium 5K15]|uniref:Uncharacterized protein n=1 Tax=Oceaniferula flava TaxID=2800421 RepID=A0AAE2SDF3_9BACT|nr:hypothetical protein [Oceaniferula flavus]MBK1854515.1 hypothetical protein [Oceaniferula flavus]MBM1135821.1 hypothetical protein [Oceaniferula flavus]